MSLTRQAVLIVGIGILIWIWQLLSLESLTVPIIGLMVLAYLVASKLTQKNRSGEKRAIDHYLVLLLSSIVVLLVFSTGGLDSSIFFLLYFAFFAIGFALMPDSVFIFMAVVVLLLLPQGLKENMSENLIKIGSLILIAPLAYFFSEKTKAELADIITKSEEFKE
ncbi:MAG: hypothetical protein HZC02_02075 [Candidatus Levybacteria bacterium]|nr:hypothetical protein [Candidatus Levybacteria bacterium]